MQPDRNNRWAICVAGTFHALTKQNKIRLIFYSINHHGHGYFSGAGITCMDLTRLNLDMSPYCKPDLHTMWLWAVKYTVL